MTKKTKAESEYLKRVFKMDSLHYIQKSDLLVGGKQMTKKKVIRQRIYKILNSCENCAMLRHDATKKKVIRQRIYKILNSCENCAIYQIYFSDAKLTTEQKDILEKELKERQRLFFNSWVIPQLKHIEIELI
jgi:uncharacterized Zn finger protein